MSPKCTLVERMVIVFIWFITSIGAVSAQITGKFQVEDYTQYVPAIAVYGIDLMGLKAKHSVGERTIVVVSSYLVSTACVQTLKRTTHIRRPDGSNYLSFPSGHTATAFVGAHILYKEYKEISPWIGVAGYAVACGTGAMRVLHKRHWITDVVAGAGFGVLSVEVSYWLLPIFRSKFVLAPVISADGGGIGMACRF